MIQTKDSGSVLHDRTINTRVTPETYLQIAEIAREMRCPVSQLVRNWLLDRVELEQEKAAA